MLRNGLGNVLFRRLNAEIADRKYRLIVVFRPQQFARSLQTVHNANHRRHRRAGRLDRIQRLHHRTARRQHVVDDGDAGLRRQNALDQFLAAVSLRLLADEETLQFAALAYA